MTDKQSFLDQVWEQAQGYNAEYLDLAQAFPEGLDFELMPKMRFTVPVEGLDGGLDFSITPNPLEECVEFCCYIGDVGNSSLVEDNAQASELGRALEVEDEFLKYEPRYIEKEPSLIEVTKIMAAAVEETLAAEAEAGLAP